MARLPLLEAIAAMKGQLLAGSARGELDGVLLNWGNMAAGLGSAAGVPEPASWLISLAALLAAAAGRKFRAGVR